MNINYNTLCTSGYKTDSLYLTYMFSIHVIEEAEAVSRRVGDTVRVFRCHVEKRTDEPGLVSFFSWS